MYSFKNVQNILFKSVNSLVNFPKIAFSKCLEELDNFYTFFNGKFQKCFKG